MEEEIRLIHSKLNDGKITVTQATAKTLELISYKKEFSLELEFLQEKMKEVILYQGFFGKDGEEKINRQAENCAKIAIQFCDKKLENINK